MHNLPAPGKVTRRFTRTFSMLSATMLVLLVLLVLLVGVGPGTALALPDSHLLAYAQTLHGAEIEEGVFLQTAPLAQPQRDGNWMAEMQQQLAEREYHLNHNGQGLQAPNRAHDLRTYFSASGISIQERSATDSSDALSIGFSGLYRDESRIVTDTTQAPRHSGNRVEIDHGLLTEWYVNTEAGLEQGFDIANKPAGEGTLRLELAIIGGQVSGSGETLTLTNDNGRRFNYQKLIVTDATGAVQAASMSAANEKAIALLVHDHNAQYPLTVDPLITSTYDTLLESDQVNAFLGYSISGAGDVNGDGYADVIVGANTFDNGERDEGVAFVYHGSASGISSVAATTLEYNQADANLGTSVSGAGDVNGDGYADVIVGAARYVNVYHGEGGAFVYHGSASGIASVATTTLESNQADANLGYSVSGAGDVNGDGYADVIVGAWQYDNGERNEGAAFVYHGSASGISSVAATTLESDKYYAFLGNSVSGAGDVNGDGYADVIVGAYLYDNGKRWAGATFVYHGSASGIATGNPAVAATTLESYQAGAYLGKSVSGAGDVNGDGYADVIVGAPGFDNGYRDEGKAFVYHGSASGIASVATTTLETDQHDAQLGSSVDAALGFSVSGAGDVNGDGYADVIVGAIGFRNGEISEGGAFVYHGSTSGISSVAATTLESDQVKAKLGFSVSGAGDVNGDGYSDVIVGTPLYDNVEHSEGGAFVYHGSAIGSNVGAIRSYTGTLPSGNTGTISFTTADPGCSFINDPRFLDVGTASTLPPQGLVLTDGLVSFVIENCSPSVSVNMSIDYGQTLAESTRYWKAGSPWYSLSASISGSVVTFTLTDGGQGDEDNISGTITDPGGAGVFNALPVPVNNQWWLLIIMLSLMAAAASVLLRGKSIQNK